MIMSKLTLKELLDKEKNLRIYDERIWGIPLWGCVKRKYRNKYMFVHAEIPPMSNHPKFNVWALMRSFVLSFWHILKLFVCSQKKSNLFLGFMRLEQVDGVYMDKFVDPIIMLSAAKDDYVYFERGRSGVHRSPRAIDNIVWTEFIDNLSLIMALFIFPFLAIFKWGTYEGLIIKVNRLIGISLKDRLYIYVRTTTCLLKIFFLCLVIKRLGVKRLFAPVAVLHFPYVAVCKLLKIPCYEVQHGITVGQTTTYSGEYVPEAYPDYFLTFGKSSLKDGLFGLPFEKMINIGCAFKSFLKKRRIIILKDTYLFLSEPQISQKMVDTLSELANLYPQYSFHLRLHPLEKLTRYQQNSLSGFPNVAIVDNVENSTIACMAYEGVIAENTTVLYEAVSVGIKAARLQYNGFHTIHFKDEPQGMFFYMKKAKDFSEFVNDFKVVVDSEFFYSTFDVENFNKITAK